MADGMTVDLQGLEQLNAAMARLPYDMQVKVAVPALRAAGKVIAGIAKTLAPVGSSKDVWGKDNLHRPGSLKRSITSRVWKPDGVGYSVNGAVFVRSGRRYGAADAFYAGMVEGGHWTLVPRKRMARHPRTGKRESVRMKREGARMAYVAPRPFMRPAVAIGKAPAFNAAVAETRKQYTRAVQGAASGKH